MPDFNSSIIDEFHKNGGQVGGQFAGMNLLLLTTTGAKSGQQRVIPLAYTKDGDGYVVAASKGGAPTNPDWYYNLLANPDVTVEVGDQKFNARATVADEADRERLYEQHANVYPGFHDYKKQTDRKIPVVLLGRVES